MNKKERAENAKRVADYHDSINRKETEKSVLSTKIYDNCFPSIALPSVEFEKTNICFCHDVEEGLGYFKKDGNFAVLDCASFKNPGGGFLNGAMGQEESLCAITNLYNILSSFRIRKLYYDSHQKSSPFYSDRMMYVPDVLYKCIGGDYSDKRRCNVIVAAAPNLSVWNNRKVSMINRTIFNRVEKILDIAMFHQNKSLLLGAIGCGVFKNPSTIVAEAFFINLYVKFAGRFDKIYFAITDYDTRMVFMEVAKKIQAWLETHGGIIVNFANPNSIIVTSEDFGNYYNSDPGRVEVMD